MKTQFWIAKLGGNMKSLIAIAYVCTAAALTGCATAQLDDLKLIKERKGMLVAEPISFVFGSSAMMMSGVQAGLMPGYYAATKENENGTFYLGSGQCVWYKGKDAYGLMTGGIWLPKKAEHQARLFSVVGEPSATAKSIDEARSFCKQPKASSPEVGLSSSDLQAVLLANPQALGVKPAGPNGTLSGSQAAGGAIGLSIAQAFADSAKGEYQIWQKVEDPDALRKMGDAVRRAETVLGK